MSKRNAMIMRRDVLASSIYRDCVSGMNEEVFDQKWQEVAKIRAQLAIELSNIFMEELKKIEQSELHADVI